MAERFAGQRDPIFNRRNRSAIRPCDPHALALVVRRLLGSCALLSLGFLAGRASACCGLIPALAPCTGWAALVAATTGASGNGATGASVVRGACDALDSTYQRESASDLMLDLGGASSSMATGTSGSAGFTSAATTGRDVSMTTGRGASMTTGRAVAARTGWGGCTRVADPVVCAVADGP